MKNFLSKLEVNSWDENEGEIIDKIDQFVKKLKGESEKKDKDDIFIYVDDYNRKFFRLNDCLDKHVCWDQYEVRGEAYTLFRSRKFEKCKIGVVYELIALYYGESDIQSDFLGEFGSEKVWEFQDDDPDDGIEYKHAKLFFTWLIKQYNFCY